MRAYDGLVISEILSLAFYFYSIRKWLKTIEMKWKRQRKKQKSTHKNADDFVHVWQKPLEPTLIFVFFIELTRSFGAHLTISQQSYAHTNFIDYILSTEYLQQQHANSNKKNLQRLKRKKEKRKTRNVVCFYFILFLIFCVFSSLKAPFFEATPVECVPKR